MANIKELDSWNEQEVIAIIQSAGYKEEWVWKKILAAFKEYVRTQVKYSTTIIGAWNMFWCSEQFEDVEREIKYQRWRDQSTSAQLGILGY